MSQQKQSGDTYRLIYKEGTHLSSSHDTEGAFRGNLLDDNTNKPVANAEWVKVDENEYEHNYMFGDQENQQETELSPEDQQLAQFVGEVLAAGTLYVLKEVVAPRVNRWWQNSALPTMKEKWKLLVDKKKETQLPKGKKKTKLHTNGIIAPDETVTGVITYELKEAYEKYKIDMTSEEAQRELLDIFILSALLTKKMIKLSNARISVNRGASVEYIEGQEILERITTPEYVHSVNQILEDNPHLLQEKAVTLSSIFGLSLVVDGRYLPIEMGMLKDATI